MCVRLFALTLLLSLLSGCGAIEGAKAADDAVKVFHQQLDAGAFNAVYAATHAEFKSSTTEKQLVDLLAAVHRKLGAVQSCARQTWNVNTYNFHTNVVLRYETKFAEGDALETFTFRIESGKPLLLGYNINSAALITK